MKIKKNEQGMSLIELLIAVTILSIGLIPLVRVLMFGLETSSRANKMTLTTNLARDLAEEIRTQAFAEEFVYPSPQCQIDDGAGNVVYPSDPSNAQCFGPEANEDEATTITSGGRMEVFDDVDDYDGWCRGEECAGTYRPLETYDGLQYNGTQGYPSYGGFTRRVRIHNIDVKNREITSFERDPFADYTSTDYTQFVKRYDFDNWSSLTRNTSNQVMTGKTPLKRIEITVTYRGATVKNVEVVDVSFAVMPSI